MVVSLSRSSCQGCISSLFHSLTGTPVQNSVLDQFSIFKFLGSPEPLNKMSAWVVKIRQSCRRQKTDWALY